MSLFPNLKTFLFQGFSLIGSVPFIKFNNALEGTYVPATFTRPNSAEDPTKSGATVIDADGTIRELAEDEAPWSYPIGGSVNGCAYLDLQPEKTNLFIHGQSPENWQVKEGTANNGGSYGDAVFGDIVLNSGTVGTGTEKGFNLLGNLTSTGKHSFGFIAKSGNGITEIRVRRNNATFDTVQAFIFNFQSETFSVNNVNAEFVKLENNIFYIFYTDNASSANAGGYIIVPTISSEVDGVNYFSVAAPQFVEGEYPNSYIPTTGSTVTRNAGLVSDLFPSVGSEFTAVWGVNADGGRLLLEKDITGIELDLTGSGQFVMSVEANRIKLFFPDNGQPQTTLEFEKYNDLTLAEMQAKLASVGIELLGFNDFLLPQTTIDSLVSGTVSSGFIETDWGAQTDFISEFFGDDWNYFPLIDTGSATDFNTAWRDNQLTTFPQLDVSSGSNFTSAWYNNNLTSFPQLDLSAATDFNTAWRNNQLTTFPANMFDTLSSAETDCFRNSWINNVIDAQGVENILVSIDTGGASAPASGVTIDIDTNGDPLTSAAQTAITNLKGKGWDPVIDAISQ